MIILYLHHTEGLYTLRSINTCLVPHIFRLCTTSCTPLWTTMDSTETSHQDDKIRVKYDNGINLQKQHIQHHVKKTWGDIRVHLELCIFFDLHSWGKYLTLQVLDTQHYYFWISLSTALSWEGQASNLLNPFMLNLVERRDMKQERTHQIMERIWLNGRILEWCRWERWDWTKRVQVLAEKPKQTKQAQICLNAQWSIRGLQSGMMNLWVC